MKKKNQTTQLSLKELAEAIDKLLGVMKREVDFDDNMKNILKRLEETLSRIL